MRYIICSILLGFAVANEAAAKKIDLDEALSLGISNSSVAYAIRAETKQLFGGDVDDTNLQNPELSLTYRGDHSSEVVLSQPLRLSDISLKRYSYRELLRSIESSEQKLDLLRIANQIKAKYYELYVAQKELQFVEKQLELSQKIQKNINSAIYTELSTAEFAVFASENKVLASEKQNLKKSLASKELLLAQELGIKAERLELKEPNLPYLPKSFKQIAEALEKQPNYQKMLKLKYEQAQKKLAIAKEDGRFPSISPQVGYGLKSYERADDWSVGVGISIPLWDRSAGKISAANAEMRLYQAQIKELENVSFEEVLLRQFAVLKEQQTQALLYKNQIIPELVKASKSMEQSFMNGSASPLDYLQVRDKEMQAQMRYLEVLTQINAAKSDMEMMIGTRLEDLR